METHHHILVIDDNLYFCDTISYVLNESGFTTAYTSTCREALVEMEKKEAEVLLLDIALSKENGMDFVPEFKKLYPKVPVIILTGSGYDRVKMQRAFYNGAMGYISKTIHAEGLISLIRSALCEISNPSSKVAPEPVKYS